MWYGADPGGRNKDRSPKFGLARLDSDGRFETWLRASVDEVVDLVREPLGLGIDAPLWWSSGEGGGRYADSWLRKTYGIHPGTVQSVNSLRGAVLVQGIMLAYRVRNRAPGAMIT